MGKKKYSDAYIAGVAKGTESTSHLTPSEKIYVDRLARNYQPGISRPQLRGHPRTKYDEKPVREVKQLREQQKPKPQKSKPQKSKPQPKPQKPPKPQAAPKIRRRITHLPGNGKLVQSYKGNIVASHVQKLASGGPQTRIYFQVWDAKNGKFVSVYQGNRATDHGITVGEFLRRVNDKLKSGEATDFADAIRKTIVDDSSAAAGVDSPKGAKAPADFTLIRLYVLPQRAAA